MNIRAGHNLPTSLTNVRQMWLEVTAKDEAGKVLFSSGAVSPDGALPDDPGCSTPTGWARITISPSTPGW